MQSWDIYRLCIFLWPLITSDKQQTLFLQNRPFMPFGKLKMNQNPKSGDKSNLIMILKAFIGFFVQ